MCSLPFRGTRHVSTRLLVCWIRRRSLMSRNLALALTLEAVIAKAPVLRPALAARRNSVLFNPFASVISAIQIKFVLCFVISGLLVWARLVCALAQVDLHVLFAPVLSRLRL